ncbi:MAG TPA: DUF3422 family protein [Methylocella sp.]|nr:DUF3422 family protein [Methylocella sp.]
MPGEAGALLRLPEAEAAAAVIRRIETELPLVVQRMRDGKGLEPSRELLAHLTSLDAELEASAAQTLYRFGATRAYHELVALRLDALAETVVVQTSAINVTKPQEHEPAHAARTAFQISGAVLPLVRSLPSWN